MIKCQETIEANLQFQPGVAGPGEARSAFSSTSQIGLTDRPGLNEEGRKQSRKVPDINLGHPHISTCMWVHIWEHTCIYCLRTNTGVESLARRGGTSLLILALGSWGRRSGGVQWWSGLHKRSYLKIPPPTATTEDILHIFSSLNTCLSVSLRKNTYIKSLYALFCNTKISIKIIFAP